MVVAIKAENRAITSYYRYQSLSDIGSARLRGPWRVIVFCLVTILVPILFLVAPLYIRYEYYKDVTYNLGESDLVTVDKPISTFWCEGQDLWMNATFHAYLLDEQPKISEDLQHFEMDKHMQLADDSLEYWGFFLLSGSKVTLSVCSRFDGSRLMVVKGTKNLKHCALLDPDPVTDEGDPWNEDVSARKGEKIEVTFEQGVHKMVRDQVSGKGNMASISRMRPSQNATAATTTSAPPMPTKVSTRPPSPKSRASTPPPKTKMEVIADGKPKPSVFLEQVDVQETEPPRIKAAKERKLPKGFTIKAKKPANVVQIEEPEEMGQKLSEKDVRPIHEKTRVQRHKTHTGLPHSRGRNRTQRFITTADEHYEEEIEQHEDEVQRTSEEHDPPPNPVGVEPEKTQVQNQAQLDLSADKGEMSPDQEQEDSVIDKHDIRSSGSSFAKNLWTCYGGDVIFTQSFSPSQRCQSQDAMMKHALRMKTVHEITSTGYYYYIFYSDNDIVSNDIFARFNIEKVVYNFPNYTNSCLNKTQCSLDLNFLSSEKVLLEVPLQDGVSDEDALAQMVLISTCKPRLGVYFIFPVSILVFIVCCAFM